eukprot:jgi/Bigna1/126965/aug1.3_g1673
MAPGPLSSSEDEDGDGRNRSSSSSSSASSEPFSSQQVQDANEVLQAQRTKKAREAVHYIVAKMCDENKGASSSNQREIFDICEHKSTVIFRNDSCLLIHHGNITKAEGLSFSKEFVYGLSELACSWIGRFGRDLGHFATHAGRKVFRPDDVLLLARNNESALNHLKSLVDAKKLGQMRKKRPSTQRKNLRKGKKKSLRKRNTNLDLEDGSDCCEIVASSKTTLPPPRKKSRNKSKILVDSDEDENLDSDDGSDAIVNVLLGKSPPAQSTEKNDVFCSLPGSS